MTTNYFNNEISELEELKGLDLDATTMELASLIVKQEGLDHLIEKGDWYAALYLCGSIINCVMNDDAYGAVTLLVKWCEMDMTNIVKNAGKYGWKLVNIREMMVNVLMDYTCNAEIEEWPTFFED